MDSTDYEEELDFDHCCCGKVHVETGMKFMCFLTFLLCVYNCVWAIDTMMAGEKVFIMYMLLFLATLWIFVIIWNALRDFDYELKTI